MLNRAIRGFILGSAIHILSEFWISAMLVQSQKAESFQVGKRNIQNQKMIDNEDSDKTVLLGFAIIYCRIFNVGFNLFEN